MPSAPEWADTRATLHLWTQVVGKVRLALAPPVNHWWHVTLAVTARGLTTLPMPCNGVMMEIAFDFIDHQLHHRPERRPAPDAVAPAAVGGRLLSASSWTSLVPLALDVRIWPDAGGDSRLDDPIRPGRDPSLVRRCGGPSLVAGAVSGGRGAQGIPRRVSREDAARCTSSGAASITPSRDSAAAARPSVRAPTCDDARGVFARGHQRRILARRWRRWPRRLSTRTPRRSRPGSRRPASARRRRSTARTSASSSSSTKTSGRLRPRAMR